MTFDEGKSKMQGRSRRPGSWIEFVWIEVLGEGAVGWSASFPQGSILEGNLRLTNFGPLTALSKAFNPSTFAGGVLYNELREWKPSAAPERRRNGAPLRLLHLRSSSLRSGHEVRPHSCVDHSSHHDTGPSFLLAAVASLAT